MSKPALKLFVSRRLLWLLPAALLFAGAGREMVLHQKMLERMSLRGIPKSKIPPTQLGHHPSFALCWTCLGLIFVILAFRKQPAAGQEPV